MHRRRRKTGFLLRACESWLQEPFDEEALLSDAGRVALAEALMGHSFMHSLMKVIESKFIQPTEIIAALTEQYVQLVEFREPTIIVDSF